MVVELQEDRTIIAPPRTEPECEHERDAVSACGRKHRWEKQGASYRLTMMTLARPRGTGGMNAMFDKPAGSGCRCVEDVVGTAEADRQTRPGLLAALAGASLSGERTRFGQLSD